MALLTPLMTKTQLMAELGIGDQALTRMRKSTARPMPPAITIGSKLYWNREEVEKWLSSHLPKNKKTNGA